MPNKQKEPIDKEQIDETEAIKEELRLYGDEAVSDSDSGWDLGREETLWQIAVFVAFVWLIQSANL